MRMSYKAEKEKHKETYVLKKFMGDMMLRILDIGMKSSDAFRYARYLKDAYEEGYNEGEQNARPKLV